MHEDIDDGTHGSGGNELVLVLLVNGTSTNASTGTSLVPVLP
jgi:hypothetical protein